MMGRNLFRTILFQLLLVVTASCSTDPAQTDPTPSVTGSDAIWFRVENLTPQATRAMTDAESRVTHLDLLIFDASGTRVHYQSLATPEERFALSVRKSYFEPDAAYDIYLFANCPVDEHLEEITDYATLKQRTVTDLYVYATGLVEREDVPTTFLMEGHLRDEVLNPTSERFQDKELLIGLSRAAAKVVMNLRAGEAVDASGSVVYELAYDGGVTVDSEITRLPMNIPYEAHLVPLTAEELQAFAPRLYTPSSPTTTGIDYGTYAGKTSATVTLYAYPNDWSTSDSYTGEPRVLIRLPMRSRNQATGAEELHVNNYYSIPLNNLPGGATSLDRNRLYTTTVTFNGLGGTEIEKAVELTDVVFTTEDWVTHDIEVDAGDNPEFLFLTSNTLRMDNTPEDHSIGFSSSSPVTVTVNEIYYYDKFGVKTTLPTDAVQVSASTGGMAGVIDVVGSVPDNNAIRYVEVTVTNGTGQLETLHIEQYPQIYITNSLGYFSYRSDFYFETGECSTWLRHDDSGFKRSDRTSVGLVDGSSSNWYWWNYSEQRNEGIAGWTGDKFFQSKVQTRDDYDPQTGLGPLGSYGYVFWTWGRSWFATSPRRNNSHIYHVRVTSTSGDYVIGRPRMKTYTDPYNPKDSRLNYSYEGTDDSEDNQKLVSPSFMIASQLGLINTGDQIRTVQQAASHCEKYVEVVYKDRNNRLNNDNALIYYDDWRLPTEAELRIIGQFQTGSEVMDIVLDRPNYWSSRGEVLGVGFGYASDGTSMSGTGVRCVRDCYRDTEEGI